MNRKITATIGLLLLATLCGCGFPPPASEAEHDADQDCRADANRIYNTQNRYQLSERTSPDTPYSGATPPSLPSDGLSDRYQYDQMVDSCVKRSGAVPVAGQTN